jgi:hypothetical protein
MGRHPATYRRGRFILGVRSLAQTGATKTRAGDRRREVVHAQSTGASERPRSHGFLAAPRHSLRNVVRAAGSDPPRPIYKVLPSRVAAARWSGWGDREVQLRLQSVPHPRDVVKGCAALRRGYTADPPCWRRQSFPRRQRVVQHAYSSAARGVSRLSQDFPPVRYGGAVLMLPSAASRYPPFRAAMPRLSPWRPC